MIFDMNTTMRLSAIRYGSFAGFFALDVANRTLQKKLDREKVDSEYKARAGVKVVAYKSMGIEIDI